MGKRSTRGNKGQKARKSGNVRIGFEGGQTPIYRRLPKFGFSNHAFKKTYVNISVSKFSKINEAVIDRDVLIRKKIINKRNKLPIKVIGNCSLNQAFSVTADAITSGAKKCILNSGGSFRLTTDLNNEKQK